MNWISVKDRLQSRIAELETVCEDLNSRLEDYRQDYAKVVNDKCPTDEIHCGCVPILRRENRLLSKELADAKEELRIRRNEEDTYREMTAGVTQLKQERDEWKQDAERLAKSFVIEAYPHEWVCRSGCHHMGKTPDTIEHAPNCPITLHRELVAKYGGEK